ncbi:MAG: TonB-dependent receptor, partial [Pseudomonadota bacterium]|nr:TonB-dependent receptor [Pseudomonadota bacterium]
MPIKTALLAAVSLSLTLPVVAQSDSDADTTLETIIVEGSRLNQAATEVGSSVTIITADDIDQLGFDFVLDAVASAPGVTINQNGPFGGSATVRIRGAQTGQTLVLVDGVPVNDPSTTSGIADFARLDTENIARIEVLKGPQSTLWGTDAIGGVISITTKDPDAGLGGTAFGEYGSYNTFRGGASLENAGDLGDFRLAITGTSSDGISKADENDGNTEKDGYDSLTLSAKGGVNLSDTVRLSTDVLWSDAETEFDTFGPADGDNSNETEEFSANVSLNADLLDGRFENLLLVGFTDIDRENFSGGASTFQSGGDRQLYRYQGTFNIDDRNTIAFGAEREETSANNQEATIDGLFALYEFKPLTTLTLTGGLRVDDHDAFGSKTTGRAAVAYNPTDTLTLRASWGQGFKAPSIFQ